MELNNNMIRHAKDSQIDALHIIEKVKKALQKQFGHPANDGLPSNDGNKLACNDQSFSITTYTCNENNDKNNHNSAARTTLEDRLVDNSNIDCNINSNKQPPRILVAMSGGVDSSVVAALMHDLGYEVIGVTLQLYDHGFAVGRKGACCAGKDIYDAQQVAAAIGIPHYVFNYERQFKQDVIDPFAQSYFNGKTPIPCILCNQKIKFRDLLQATIDLQADYMATGHYVQKMTCSTAQEAFTAIEDSVEDSAFLGNSLESAMLIKDNMPAFCDSQPNQLVHRQNYQPRSSRSELHKAINEKKDQSYFLFTMTNAQLSQLLFPLGCLSKEETRILALYYKLDIHDKSDSQNICFVPDGNYASVVTKIANKLPVAGEIVNMNNEVIGQHRGIIHYTVGQRKGLELDNSAHSSTTEPLYVIRIDAINNRIVVGTRDELQNRLFIISNISWIADDLLLYTQFDNKEAQKGMHAASLIDAVLLRALDGFRCEVKVRSTARQTSAILRYRDTCSMFVEYITDCIESSVISGSSIASQLIEFPVAAPGQACVIYRGSRLLGGGWIEDADFMTVSK